MDLFNKINCIYLQYHFTLGLLNLCVVENDNVTSDNITSSSVPSLSVPNLSVPSSSNTVLNKKRKLNENVKHQKDEKLKSDTAKSETGKCDIYEFMIFSMHPLFHLQNNFLFQAMNLFYGSAYDCLMVQRKQYQCVQQTP